MFNTGARMVVRILISNEETMMQRFRDFIPYILTQMLAMLLLTGCQQEQEDLWGATEVEYSKTPVSFVTQETGTTGTRGTELQSTWSTTEYSKMAVWAYYYQYGESTPQSMLQEKEITYEETSSGSRIYAWNYTPVIYWPKSGTMDFFAYAPACMGARKQINNILPSNINYQALLMNCHVPASQITTIHSLGSNNTAVTTFPHDAKGQHDLMFAFERNMKCDEQSTTSKVNFKFVHAMAGLKINMSEFKMDDNGTPGDPSDDTPKIPDGTSKIIIGIGRIKTGGTLAICEPATDGVQPTVVWTLDGLEGTFYETYSATWSGGDPNTVSEIKREQTGITAKDPENPTDAEKEAWESDATFFFPPQPFETGLTVTAYFYNASNVRLGYRTRTLPTTGDEAIKELKRGEIITLNIQ